MTEDQVSLHAEFAGVLQQILPFPETIRQMEQDWAYSPVRLQDYPPTLHTISGLMPQMATEHFMVMIFPLLLCAECTTCLLMKLFQPKYFRRLLTSTLYCRMIRSNKRFGTNPSGKVARLPNSLASACLRLLYRAHTLK